MKVIRLFTQALNAVPHYGNPHPLCTLCAFLYFSHCLTQVADDFLRFVSSSAQLFGSLAGFFGALPEGFSGLSAVLGGLPSDFGKNALVLLGVTFLLRFLPVALSFFSFLLVTAAQGFGALH